jgi:hypothetical protein
MAPPASPGTTQPPATQAPSPLTDALDRLDETLR